MKRFLILVSAALIAISFSSFGKMPAVSFGGGGIKVNPPDGVRGLCSLARNTVSAFGTSEISVAAFDGGDVKENLCSVLFNDGRRSLYSGARNTISGAETSELAVEAFDGGDVKVDPPRFRVLAIAENGGHHILYSKAARVWLDKLAADSSFSIDYISDATTIDDSLLSQYQLFIQLDYPPYAWPEKAVAAFQRYIEMGKGGWIGFHHAGLLGEFDGYPMWRWFSKFMGDIRFKNYIASFAVATVNLEDKKHPVMKNVPASFPVVTEEWYTFNKSPRPNVHVLASVDEATYIPNSDIKMGDHPVVWTNPHYKAKNIYIFMGHSPDLFDNPSYTTLFRNAIFWAAKK